MGRHSAHCQPGDGTRRFRGGREGVVGGSHKGGIARMGTFGCGWYQSGLEKGDQGGGKRVKGKEKNRLVTSNDVTIRQGYVYF